MSDYIAFVQNHGLLALIIIAIIAVLTPLLTHFSENGWYIKTNTRYLSQLIEHSFFSHIHYWRNIGIDAVEIKDKGRNMIFKDLLHIQFRLFEIAMRNSISHNEVNTLTSLALKQHITREITHALTQCEMEARQMGIPDIVRNKFSKWNYRSILFLMNGIEGVFESVIYKNNTERLSALLSFVLAVFHATLLDAERTLQELNGELIGIAYKGFIVKQ